MLPMHPCRGVHGHAQVATLARLLPHRCTCPSLSPVCHQPPEGAVSPAHLPVALPRRLGWTRAPLSDRQRQWHRGTHGPWVGPWHPPHGPWHSVGCSTAQALRGLPWAPVPPSWRCPGTAPKPARQAAEMGGREVGDNFAHRSPSICHLHPAAGSWASPHCGLSTGRCGAAAPPAEPEHLGGAELEMEAGAEGCLLPIAVALAMPCPLLGAQQMLWGHRLAQNIPLGGDVLCSARHCGDWSYPGAGGPLASSWGKQVWEKHRWGGGLVGCILQWPPRWLRLR